MGSAASANANRNKVSHGISLYSSVDEISRKENQMHYINSIKSVTDTTLDALATENKFSNKVQDILEGNNDFIPQSYDNHLNNTNDTHIPFGKSNSRCEMTNDNVKSEKEDNDPISAKLSRSISQITANPSHEVPLTTLRSTGRKRSIVALTEENVFGQSIKSFNIETFNYADVKKNEIDKFHIISRTNSTLNLNCKSDSSEQINLSTNENETVLHTCNLCNMTFESQEKFIDHTKFSKIHMISVLKYNSTSNTERNSERDEF